jgi:acetylornithine/succinyldiaminopimelate/putrescine aminotransferase
MGDEYWRNAYRPLLPGILHLDYNSMPALEQVTSRTACVIAETVQGEMGVQAPTQTWLKALRQKCDHEGALLVLDEIQTGFGRTGSLWGFEQYEIVPDILLLGKALGGGMPLGAFVADAKLMWSLTESPVLGHITTFGGHPVSCAAGMASLQVLKDEGLIDGVKQKEELLLSLLIHPAIKKVRSAGLLMAVEFENFETNKKVIDGCLRKGLLTDWFLFAPQCMRIAPPLVISGDEARLASDIIIEVLNELT